MPNIDGFAVLEYFKENNLFNKIPVAIITGDDSKEAIEKAFKYPIVDMLNKPFNEKDVKIIVEKTVNYGK
jgi:putative two-component system response regulator